MRVKAVVAYDGTDYHGFQLQKDLPTIQSELERVLETLTGTSVRVFVAGRTDAGVHAKGQVIAFDVVWRHSLSALQRAMNANLPLQIAVMRLAEVASDFHPRYDAQRRCYRYTIYNAKVRNPLVQRCSLYVPRPLAVTAMQAAAQRLLGIHDFGAFGSPPQGNSTVREVFSATWLDEKPWLRFEIEANAFLYRMVRILVGTLIRVGLGALTPEQFGEILHSQDRSSAGPAVAPHGLVLKSVTYKDRAW